MKELTISDQLALEYIDNTGGQPRVEWFDDDHDPIGSLLRESLFSKNLIEYVDDTMRRVQRPSGDTEE